MREFRDLKTPQEIRANFEPYEKRYQVETWNDFYQKLGNGDISIASLSNFIISLNNTSIFWRKDPADSRRPAG